MSLARNEWEKIKLAVVTGANAATNIAVTGMAAEDAIIGIVNLTDAAAVSLAGLVITDGNFKITASTASKALLVLWVDKSAG